MAFEEIKNKLIKPPILHLPNVREDSTYIQTQANLLLEVLCIKSKMEGQN